MTVGYIYIFLGYLNGRRNNFTIVVFIIKEFSLLTNPLFQMFERNSTIIFIYYNLLYLLQMLILFSFFLFVNNFEPTLFFFQVIT